MEICFPMGPGESDFAAFLKPNERRKRSVETSSQPQIKAHQQREVIQPWPSGVELNLKRRVEFAEGHERLTIVQRKGFCDQDRFQMPELPAFENVDIGVHIQPVAAAGDFDFFREASAHM